MFRLFRRSSSYTSSSYTSSISKTRIIFTPFTDHQYQRTITSLSRRVLSSSSIQLSKKYNDIRILYASQTGTSQLFAHELSETLEVQELANDITVQSLDDEPPNEVLSPGKLHLMLVSCAGKGEPPDNGREFYNWIMNDPSAKVSNDVSYAIFGLGNESAHPNHYNVVGKRLDAKLYELGAHRMSEIGLGDDGGISIEGDFDEWVMHISKLIAAGNSQEDDDGESTNTEEVSDTTSISEDDKVMDQPAITTDKTRPTSKKYPTIALDPAQGNVIRRDLFHLTGSNKFYGERTAKLKVIDNQILTPDAGESVLREFRISLECDYNNEEQDGELSFTTGDHLLVYPRNSETIVNAYIDLLGVDPHMIISEENNNGSYPHPTGITIAETLSHCIDLSALPSPSFSRMILGRSDVNYVDEIANQRRTVIDLCYQEGFRLSLEDLLHNAAPIKPRYYSIASSSVHSPHEVHLVFRPVHYMTSMGYLREGVCTNFMAHKGAAQKGPWASYIPAFVSPNPSFRLPDCTKTPVMFIAGGCGVAPIKAFIDERIELKRIGHELGPGYIYLGFRNPQDEVYQDLIQKALDIGALTESEVVYSTGVDAVEKSYCQLMLVSDLIRQRGDHIWKHFNNGGHVYMCGGARNFGAAIEAAFLDIFQEQGGVDFDEADKYLRELDEKGQLSEDIA